MPYAINRKNLENVLKKFRKVVRNNGPLQALRCIKVQGEGSVIKLSCTDGQVAISEEIPGEFPEIFCVNLKELTTILKSIRSPEIFIDLDQDKVLITTAEGESFSLPTIPAEDFPVIGDRDGAKQKFRISSCSLHAGLKRCFPFASDDPTRPYIHGAHFLCSGNSLRIESTDGHRLFIESGMLCEVRGACDFILPYPLLPVLLDMTRKNPRTVEVSENGSSIYFTMERTLVSARKTDSVFPPVNTVIPESPVIACKALRKELLSAVESARKMGGRDITMELKISPESLIVSTSETPTGGRFERTLSCRANGWISMGFNPKYLSDALKTLEADSVVLELTDTRTGAVLREGKITMVIMPIRLAKEELAVIETPISDIIEEARKESAA